MFMFSFPKVCSDEENSLSLVAVFLTVPDINWGSAVASNAFLALPL